MRASEARAVCSLLVCGGVVSRREGGRVYEEKRRENMWDTVARKIFISGGISKVIIGMETWEIKFSVKIHCQ